MAADSHIDTVVDSAEALLSRRFGGTQQLSGIEELGGLGTSIVLRARVAHSPFLPHRSVIVKHTPVTGSDIDDAAFLREIVAYQFTNSLAESVRPGPALLAYDVDERIVVLTDLGSSATLIDALHGAEPEECIALFRSLGGALGRLHAGTAGKDAAFDVLLKRLVKAHPEYERSQALRDEALTSSIRLGEGILSRAGLDVPAEFSAVAEEARASLQSSQEQAFTPFDLTPDNIIYAGRIHFLDYEWAGYRNVAFDVGSVISGFPQFLFSRPVDDAEVETFLTAWTREIQDVWPKLVEPEYRKRVILTALVGWALSSLATMAIGGLEPLATFVQKNPESVGVGATVADGDSATMMPGAELLRPYSAGDFSDDDTLIRQDLYESFEALARYAMAPAEGTPREGTVGTARPWSAVAHRDTGRSAETSTEDRGEIIGRFAQRVAARLASPN